LAGSHNANSWRQSVGPVIDGRAYSRDIGGPFKKAPRLSLRRANNGPDLSGIHKQTLSHARWRLSPTVSGGTPLQAPL